MLEWTPNKNRKDNYVVFKQDDDLFGLDQLSNPVTSSHLLDVAASNSISKSIKHMLAVSPALRLTSIEDEGFLAGKKLVYEVALSENSSDIAANTMAGIINRSGSAEIKAETGMVEGYHTVKITYSGEGGLRAFARGMETITSHRGMLAQRT